MSTYIIVSAAVVLCLAYLLNGVAAFHAADIEVGDKKAKISPQGPFLAGLLTCAFIVMACAYVTSIAILSSSILF